MINLLLILNIFNPIFKNDSNIPDCYYQAFEIIRNDFCHDKEKFNFFEDYLIYIYKIDNCAKVNFCVSHSLYKRLRYVFFGKQLVELRYPEFNDSSKIYKAFEIEQSYSTSEQVYDSNFVMFPDSNLAKCNMTIFFSMIQGDNTFIAEVYLYNSTRKYFFECSPISICYLFSNII
jgi:hypothetical protein